MQDFYPTPGTVSTCMYYTGIDPLTMKPVYVTTDYHEKKMQRALLQWGRPENASLVREALRICGREDLIGKGPGQLVGEERVPQAKHGGEDKNAKQIKKEFHRNDRRENGQRASHERTAAHRNSFEKPGRKNSVNAKKSGKAPQNRKNRKEGKHS